MADVGVIADLLRAPLFQQAFLRKLPGGLFNRPGIHRAAFVCKTLRLLRAVSTPSSVTAQFPTNRGGMTFKHVGNLG